MDGAALLAFLMTGGITLMLVVPGLAALYVKLFRRSDRFGSAATRTVEIEDVFHPAQQRQTDQIVAEDMLRVDAESGGDDPLHEFPDADHVRDQLDPEHVHEARRQRSRDPGPS